MSDQNKRMTVIQVIYPAQRGSIGIRGDRAPLSWEETTKPTSSDGDQHTFELQINEGDLVEFKFVRNEEEWAGGRNYMVHAGERVHVDPYFDAQGTTLIPNEEVVVGEEKLLFSVLLPPSYNEQENKRYPVLYMQDGQALWSTSPDPYGVWSLEKTLDTLFELNALEEVIVVGVDTSERRIERLSPMADPEHGGGEGEAHLRMMIDHLIPLINGRFRTRTERENTAVMGSSMGGLFSFYAAWSRPDVFGKAACLSSSFWWANRGFVQRVQNADPPEPRPYLYLDSGAAVNAWEKDPNARDGFHHTRSMLRALLMKGYTPGVDLHRLAFTGQTHDANSWAARVAVPLQLLFPPSAGSHIPIEEILSTAA